MDYSAHTAEEASHAQFESVHGRRWSQRAR